MNKAEARQILVSELQKYRSKAYSELVSMMGNQDCYDVTAPSGTEYQIEIDVIYDSKNKDSVRVVGSIDDGGI